MKHTRMKKIIALAILSLTICANLYPDTQWTATSGTVPNDGITYFVTTDIGIDPPGLTIDGILEVRTGGNLRNFSTTREITINKTGKLSFVGGTTINAGTINVYGSVYAYSLMTMADGANGGTINVSFPGKLYMLSSGGSILTPEAASTINVNSGGSLYNYLGSITANPGSLNVNAGGKFHHVRGTFVDSSFTTNNGSIFMDTQDISLDKNLDVDYTWTITGKQILRGNGKEIKFGPNGAIVITKDASLLLQDVMLDDVSAFKIRCIDNNSTLTLDNVGWYQDANYSFTKGRIYVAGDWTIAGDDTIFSYETTQTSTIKSNATLTVKHAELRYNQSSSSNLIEMEDANSIIHLDKGILLAKQPWTLSTGSLVTTGSTTLNGVSILNLSSINSIHMNVATLELGAVIF